MNCSSEEHASLACKIANPTIARTRLLFGQLRQLLACLSTCLSACLLLSPACVLVCTVQC
jgi:hypothetical protein